MYITYDTNITDISYVLTLQANFTFTENQYYLQWK